MQWDFHFYREIPHFKVRFPPIVIKKQLLYSDPGEGKQINKGGNMLYWTLVFFIFAVVAAVLGFTGIAASAAYVAKVLFVIFILLFLVSLVFPKFRSPPA